MRERFKAHLPYDALAKELRHIYLKVDASVFQANKEEIQEGRQGEPAEIAVADEPVDRYLQDVGGGHSRHGNHEYEAEGEQGHAPVPGHIPVKERANDPCCHPYPFTS